MKKRIKNWDGKLYSTAHLLANVLLIAGCAGFFGFAVANDEPEFGIPCLVAGIIFYIGIRVKLYLAGYFYSVAIVKGYTDTVYLKLAFFTVVAGYLLVVALPDRNRLTAPAQNPTVNTTAPANDLPEL